VPALSARDARLSSDLMKIRDLVNSSAGRLRILSAKGNPPYEYEFEYRLRSIVKLDGNNPTYGASHIVRIRLPANYPIGQPIAETLTPIFHPHVFHSNVICIGRRWMASEFLDLFVKRVGAIISFDPSYFDFKSPANQDAMDWAKNHMHLFPTDTFELGGSRPSVEWKEIKRIEWKNM